MLLDACSLLRRLSFENIFHFDCGQRNHPNSMSIFEKWRSANPSNWMPECQITFSGTMPDSITPGERWQAAMLTRPLRRASRVPSKVTGGLGEDEGWPDPRVTLWSIQDPWFLARNWRLAPIPLQLNELMSTFSDFRDESSFKHPSPRHAQGRVWRCLSLAGNPLQALMKSRARQRGAAAMCWTGMTGRLLDGLALIVLAVFQHNSLGSITTDCSGLLVAQSLNIPWTFLVPAQALHH